MSHRLSRLLNETCEGALPSEERESVLKQRQDFPHKAPPNSWHLAEESGARREEREGPEQLKGGSEVLNALPPTNSRKSWQGDLTPGKHPQETCP